MLTVLLGIFGTSVVGSVGWISQKAFLLEKRVTIIETKQEDLPDLINAKFEDMNRRLDRIERNMNGHYKGDQ